MKGKRIVSTMLAVVLLFHISVSLMAQEPVDVTGGSKPEYIQGSDSGETGMEECSITYEEFEREVGKLQSESDGDMEYIPVEPGEETEFDYQTCRLIVKATEEITDESAVGCAGPYNGIYIFQYEDEVAAKAADLRLDALDEVEFSEPDRVYSIPEQQSSQTGFSLFGEDESGESLSGLSDYLGLGSDWGATACAFSDMWDILLEKYGSVEEMPEITVADLDTGINYGHECFVGRISGYVRDFVDGGNPVDYHGHGTQVASIVTQNTPDNVKIVPLKVFDENGKYMDSNLYLAVEYAIEKKVDILNMSFGGYGLDSVTDQYMRDAIKAGIIVTAAYGNYGEETDDIYPACYPGVIGVSAVNQSKTLASFSCYGTYVDIAAPGKELRAAHINGKSSYATVSGTSYASPYVAAAAALLLTYDPQSTSGEIASVLYGNAEDIGAKGWDPLYGYGLLSFDGIYLDEQLPAPVYNVDFITNGGTAIAVRSIDGGQKLSQPSTPTREGYHFLGWYSDPYYLNRYDFTRSVSSDLVLYAKWEKHSYSPSDIKVIRAPSYTSSGVSQVRCGVCNQLIQTITKARLSLGPPSVKAVKNSTKGITLSWKKVKGAAGYYIYRKKGNGSWKKIKTISAAGTLSYTDSKAENGKTYSYRIRAYNKVQNSSYSAASKLRRIKTPQSLSAKRTKKGVKLQWKKVTSVSGYLVYRRTPKGSWKKIATVKGEGTISYIDQKAKKGKKYEYRIRAYKLLEGTNYYSAYIITPAV